MAYVTYGSADSTTITKWKVSGYSDTSDKYTSIVNVADTKCVYIKKSPSTSYSGVFQYDLKVVNRGDATLTYNFSSADGDSASWTRNLTYLDDGHVYTDSGTGSFVQGKSGIHDTNNYTEEFKYNSNIPIFDSDEQAIKYVTSGDDSGKVNEIDLKTEWKIYIDGSKNPNYKLLWKCAGVESENKTDNCKIKVQYVSVDDYNGIYNIVDSEILQYSQGNLKMNFNNIYNIIYDGSFISSLIKSDIIILMTLEYYQTPTLVLPSSNSSTMFIRLHYSESDGHMYSIKGYWDGNGLSPASEGDGSTIEVIEGSSGEGDDGYKDGTDEDETDGTSSSVSGGVGALTATYKMTLDRLNQLGSFLWGAGIFDEFSLVNNNPIENIISCKCIPISKDGTQQEIKLGNVSTGTNGDKLSGNFEKIGVGSITISEYYKNFLDYAPYTNIIIYLPYIGFKELDTNMVMGKAIKVDYVVDVITGSCLAQIYADNVRLYEYNGNMGIDIPITASNRAQVEASYISSAIGVGTSLLAGNVAGAATSLLNSAQAQYHYSQSGSPSPNCIASINRTCYIVIDRPQYQDLSAFNHTRGRKCNLSKTIKDLNGYTICDEHIDLSTISATSEEKDEIREILSSGFFA